MSLYTGMIFTINEEMFGTKITVACNSKDGQITIRESNQGDPDKVVSIFYDEARELIRVLECAIKMHERPKHGPDS